MVGVILGAPSHATLDRDLLQLIPSFNDEFSTVKPVKDGETIARAASLWGQQAELRATEGVTVKAWGPVKVQTVLEAPAVSALQRGQRVGRYEAVVNGKAMAVPLVSAGTISDPGLKWRVQNRDTLTY